MATWHTPESIRAEWLDAEQISDPQLVTLLNAAQEQVLAYAPALVGAPVTIPDSWRLAHQMQTQNLYNASRVDAQGGIGDGDTFVIRPHPLDWQVKALLRPNRGRPHVG